MSNRGQLSRRQFLRYSPGGLLSALLLAGDSLTAAEQPLPFPAGAAQIDITPPCEVGMLMSSGRQQWAPFEKVRLPLFARALVVGGRSERVALVSLDLLGLAGAAVGGRERFKARVAAAAHCDIPPDRIILACTHTHTGPESIALTSLCERDEFHRWVDALARKIGAAIAEAAGKQQPCQLRVATGAAPGLAVQRRLRTTRGIQNTGGKPPPETVLGPDGPTDERVVVAAWCDAAERPVAILVHAPCHPVHEMCIRQVSPDFPGEMCRALGRQHPDCVSLYLNGAAGNLNPPTVSGGADDARRHGERLAGVAQKLLGEASPVAPGPIDCRWRTLKLPARNPDSSPAAEPLTLRLGALALGKLYFVFLPGEPFVQTGLAIREAFPGQQTVVVGYADDYLGYIPTDQAFDAGGYEVRPGRWSRLVRGDEPQIRRAAIELLQSLINAAPKA